MKSIIQYGEVEAEKRHAQQKAKIERQIREYLKGTGVPQDSIEKMVKEALEQFERERRLTEAQRQAQQAREKNRKKFDDANPNRDP